ncbi:MAG: hypothetical protein CVU53_02645 [Deltaproteobacteria bacterium HGW-Deltaproteobacteria-11]|nr:MAG: hypothetical protein CVU53_02645 [Deltaproteobacteria bacterium HGW-Deltaproteobacteria-11]
MRGRHHGSCSWGRLIFLIKKSGNVKQDLSFFLFPATACHDLQVVLKNFSGRAFFIVMRFFGAHKGDNAAE